MSGFATDALVKLLELIPDPIGMRLLDIGAHPQSAHGPIFKHWGFDYLLSDMSDGVGYLGYKNGACDVIWASHVLEHQVNPGVFLGRMADDLYPGGYLAITVPPAKPQIVGGHVTIWNAGLLLYHLVLAGFDCSRAMVHCYGYNISVIVQYEPITLPPLIYGMGDIELLADYFPIPVHQGFDGNINSVNW